MKKPHIKKLPKKPKATASNSALANYFRKVDAINAENKAKITAYNQYKKDHAHLVGRLGSVKHTTWATIPAYDRKPTVKAYTRSSVVRKADRRVKGVKKKKSTHKKKKR